MDGDAERGRRGRAVVLRRQAQLLRCGAPWTRRVADLARRWRDPADRLLIEALIPAARAGLADLDVTDSRGYLDVIEQRVRSRQTGAVWQRRALAARGGDVYAMMAAYCEGQRSGAPVHEWDI